MRALTTPERHQLAIAWKTLKMNDVMATIMGSMSREEAVKVIFKLTGKKVATTYYPTDQEVTIKTF